MYLTGFPLEVENNLQIVFGVGLSSEQAISSPAFIPQLMSVILINQASLQSKAGSLLGQITLYYEVSTSVHAWIDSDYYSCRVMEIIVVAMHVFVQPLVGDL